jgi:hypothetical protein
LKVKRNRNQEDQKMIQEILGGEEDDPVELVDEDTAH